MGRDQVGRRQGVAMVDAQAPERQSMGLDIGRIGRPGAVPQPRPILDRGQRGQPFVAAAQEQAEIAEGRLVLILGLGLLAEPAGVGEVGIDLERAGGDHGHQAEQRQQGPPRQGAWLEAELAHQAGQRHQHGGQRQNAAERAEVEREIEAGQEQEGNRQDQPAGGRRHGQHRQQEDDRNRDRLGKARFPAEFGLRTDELVEQAAQDRCPGKRQEAAALEAHEQVEDQEVGREQQDPRPAARQLVERGLPDDIGQHLGGEIERQQAQHQPERAVAQPAAAQGQHDRQETQHHQLAQKDDADQVELEGHEDRQEADQRQLDHRGRRPPCCRRASRGSWRC